MLPLLELTATSVVEKRHFLKGYFKLCSRRLSYRTRHEARRLRNSPCIDVWQSLC